MKKNYFEIYIFLIVVSGCSTKMQVSEYAKNGLPNQNFYYTYKNDSLKFSIDFFGSHALDTNSIKAKKITIPVIERKLLLHYNIKKANFLFKYGSSLRPDDNTCYCYISGKKSVFLDSSKFIFTKNSNGDQYFYCKNLNITSMQLNVISGVPLKDDILFFVHSRIRSQSFKEDSFLVVTNALVEVASVKLSSAYQQFFLARKNLTNIIDKALFNKDDYIKSLISLKEISLDTIGKYALDNYYFQALITKVSFLDDLVNTRKYVKEYNYYSSADTGIKGNQSNFNSVENALNLVLEISKAQKMLMINESHYDYRNRLFIYLLLDNLYKNGYRNLCLEDRSTDTAVNQTYPSQDDGFYISEPFMGSLVRKAQQLGFNIYGYDAAYYNIDDRERNQAINLYKLYKKDSINKWIVYGGYDHINKVSFGAHKSTYQYFSALAGFSPYSINQSYFSDISRSISFNSDTIGFYALYGNPSSERLNQSDLYIVNNIAENPFSFPFGILNTLLKQYSFTVNTQLHSNAYLIVYVRKEFEILHNASIPVYIGKIKSDTINIYIPPGDYISEVIDY